MKALRDAFLNLDTGTGIGLIIAAVAVVTAIALVVSLISFRAGQRAAEQRHSRFSIKRRELSSIG